MQKIKSKMKHIILASTSVRRKELLDRVSIPYYTIEPMFEEKIPADFENNISNHFACEKVRSVLHAINENYKDVNFVLGADTLIICDDTIIGKPKNKEEAIRFIKTISGRTHLVETSIALYNKSTEKITSRTTVNQVSVLPLSEDDINWYINKNEWTDAAGAYKIQGAFQRFIHKIEGTQSSIMGLPLSEICDILIEQGYDFS